MGKSGLLRDSVLSLFDLIEMKLTVPSTGANALRVLLQRTFSSFLFVPAYVLNFILF